MMSRYTSLLLVFLPIVCLALPSARIGRTIINGDVTGDSEHFRGIPYAEPPVGSLRFQPPRLQARMSVSTFNATSYSPQCLQPGQPAEGYSEDCLTLNILRPAGSHNKSRLPVLVWIHGGAFGIGGSANRPGALVERSLARGTPTIFVNLNYRLSLLGFPHGPEASKLNMHNLGLKDQFTAFEWIQENIGAFGGDPKKVTIFGESAGAVSIAYHQLNPKLPKVARGAILESGSTGTASLGPLPRHASFGKFIQNAGCGGHRNPKTTLSCLQALDTETLRTLILAEPFSSYMPTLDGPKGLLPDYPSRLYAQGKFTRIPTLLGTNLDEPVNSTEQVKTGLLELFRGPVSDFALDRFAEKLLRLYPDVPALGSPFGTGNETFGLSSQFKRMSALLTDVAFAAPYRAQALAFSGVGVKTYGYLFTEPHSRRPPYMGVAHANEIPFVYGNVTLEPVAQPVKHLSNIMMDYWLSFSSVLHPNDGKGLDRPKWVEYTPRSRLIMKFDSRGTRIMKDDFREKNIQYIMDNSKVLGV
ncbi:hypothetical protein ONZ45_g337 [Pleurotus djamor]|nr:hypothetical protein ONZ45_g337 [Pleurotus djamor]